VVLEWRGDRGVGCIKPSITSKIIRSEKADGKPFPGPSRLLSCETQFGLKTCVSKFPIHVFGVKERRRGGDDDVSEW
jgi:hypothetical protein